MKKYLEYNDEKSAKFWAIEVQELTYTVTYGKIGTNGQQKTKIFEIVEDATTAAKKLVQAKLKKGYQEASDPINILPVSFQLIEEAAAEERFNLMQYDPLGSWDYEAFVLIEGDVALEMTLTDDAISTAFFNGKRETQRELIIITGNLTIKGGMELYAETSYPCLLILGDVHCDFLHSYDNFIHIAGDAYIKQTYHGSYNHGAIKIAGITHVPYLVNSDHHSDLRPSEDTIVINGSNNVDDFFIYDYYRDDLPKVLLEEVLYFDKSYGEYEFDFARFKEAIEANKNPFKKGAKPWREVVVEEIGKLAVQNTTQELHLKKQRLLELPAALFSMTNLEVLVLEENDFSIIPEELGQLTNLKELNLKNTKIESLPESIGALTNLEVLNLAYCQGLKSLPTSIGNLSQLKKLVLWGYQGTLPERIFQLPQLEELEILNVYGLDREGKIAGLPSWVLKFKGLKKLRFPQKMLTEQDRENLLELNYDLELVD